MRGVLVLSILILWLVQPEYDASAQREPATFVYYVDDEASGKSTLHFLDTTTFEESTVEAPLISYIALSPDNSRIAYSDQESWVYILELASGITSRLDFQMLVNLDVFYDRQTFLSGSLSWTPDGTRLAFAGRDANGTVGVFVYSVASGEVVIVTDSDRGFHNDLVEVSSWSPDGNWLAIAADWNGPAAGGFDTMLIAVDGTQRVEFPTTVRCRTVWSPDTRYVLSDLTCSRSFPGNLPLILFEFDKETLTLSDVSSRLETLELEYHFTERRYPVWIDTNTIRYVRYVYHSSHIYGSGAFEQIVEADVFNSTHQAIYEAPAKTWQEMVSSGVLLAEPYSDWPIYEGYDLNENEPVFAINGAGLCVPSTMRISKEANLVFVLGGCSETFRTPPLNLFDYRSGSSVFRGPASLPVRPVGFMLTQLIP